MSHVVRDLTSEVAATSNSTMGPTATPAPSTTHVTVVVALAAAHRLGCYPDDEEIFVGRWCECQRCS